MMDRKTGRKRNDSVKSALRRWFPTGVQFYRDTKARVRRFAFGVGAMGVFDMILREGRWGVEESRSGGGSNLVQTARIREDIPCLLRRLGAKSLFDAPCGDWYWMQLVELGEIEYIGADVVAPLIASCQQRFERQGRRFVVLDIVNDPLPYADVILCRDCLVHLSYEHIFTALANFRASGAKYLLTTTFPDHRRNVNISTGDWRPLNLQRAPFNLPEPIETINEGCTEGGGAFRDKSLALWRIDSLPSTYQAREGEVR